MLRLASFRRLIFLVLLLAFVLRLHQLDVASIWWDEGHSIEMASAPLTKIAALPGMDVHPPGYFFALHVWMIVAGTSEFALRYLSVVFSLLTVALLARFGQSVCVVPAQAAGWRARLSRAYSGGLLAGTLAALLPLYVAYAQEVRMYAMVTFWAALAGYAQWRILFRSAGRRWWIVYSLTTAAALYTHYFALFVIAFQALAWLVWSLAAGRRREHLRRPVAWAGALLAALVLFAPQLSLALRQTTAYANPNLHPPTWLEFLARSWLAYTAGLTIYPELAWLAGFAALLTLAGVGLWLWRAPGRRGMGALLYLVGWLCVPLALYYLVLQRRPSFEPRYLIAVTPAVVLLWAAGISAVPLKSLRHQWGDEGRIAKTGPWSVLPSLLALAFVAVTAVGTYVYSVNVANFKDDSAGVVRWLATETTIDDQVYVDVPHPFHYYADRLPAPLRYLFVDIHTVAATLNAEAAGRRRIYWVTWHGSDTDPRGVVPFLLDKVAPRGGERDFRGYHVTWWPLPEETHFSLPDRLTPVEIDLDDLIRVDGVAFGPTCRPGDHTWATLHFALLAATGVDYRASLRLRDAGGAMLPPTDKDILNDRHLRTSAWPVDDARLNQAVNVYTLPVPADAAPGVYRLELIVYDATTLVALPVTGAASPDGFSALLGTVTVHLP
jgi:hypothetical protein